MMSKMSKQAWGMGTAQPPLALRTQWTVSWCRPWMQFARVGRAFVGVPISLVNWWDDVFRVFISCGESDVLRFGEGSWNPGKKDETWFCCLLGTCRSVMFFWFCSSISPQSEWGFFFEGEHGSMVWNSIGRLWEVQPFQRNIRNSVCHPMATWWFGILGVPLSNNSFWEGDPTNPNHQTKPT